MIALRAGLRSHSAEHAHGAYTGIDAIVADMVRQRDVDVTLPPLPAFDRTRFEELAKTVIAMCRGLAQQTRGERYLANVKRALERALRMSDPALMYAEIRNPLTWPRKEDSQESEGVRRRSAALDGVQGASLPAQRPDRVGRRVARAVPGVARRAPRAASARRARALRKAKARRQVVDQLDLLLLLRDLLRDDPRARAACQALFDHVLVDEFQDTDPLQAEVVLFLCEDGTAAKSLRPGGGRAGQAHDRRRPEAVDLPLPPRRHRGVRPSPSDRDRQRRAGGRAASRISGAPPGLIDWFNDCLSDLLGRGEPGDPAVRLDERDGALPRSGAPRRRQAEATCVHVLPFQVAPGTTAERPRVPARSKRKRSHATCAGSWTRAVSRCATSSAGQAAPRRLRRRRRPRGHDAEPRSAVRPAGRARRAVQLPGRHAVPSGSAASAAIARPPRDFGPR